MLKKNGISTAAVSASIGAVHAITLDVLGEALANGAFGGICGIGCAHHFTPLRDSVFALQNQDHDRSFGHERDEPAEERALFVYRVEAFGLSLRQPFRFQRDDTESAFFRQRQNRADIRLFFTASGLMIANVLSCAISIFYLELPAFSRPSARVTGRR